jgi:hypothetical protein
MRANYIGPDAASKALVVWSRPLPAKSDATLGAAGLGLAALAGLDQAQPNAVPLADLQGLGRFIVFLQRSGVEAAARPESLPLPGSRRLETVGRIRHYG